MKNNIKAKSVNGVIWTFVENMSLSMITFVIGVIMARLLMPSDYGVLAIILVFISILQLFVDGGFAMALVQDKTKGPRDYSTIFTFNVAVSIICYLLLFFTAPLISMFYNTEITLYIRVIGVNLIIGALSAIHKVKYVADVNFKPLAIVNALSSLISGGVGITMAYIGFGIWALIAQNLTSVAVSSLILVFKRKWHPVCLFDKASFKKLYPIGGRIMITNIIDRVYANLYPIIVGKFYTTQELGYFSRADGLVTFPASTASSVLYRVTFPVLSSITDEQQLISVYRRYIQLSSFLLFPMLLLMFVLAKPLILILLTTKWSSIIVLFQILCLSWLLNHISAINLNLLYVKGRSDLALKIVLIKRFIAIGIVIFSVQFGLMGLCIGKVVYGLFDFFMNSIYTKRLINISLIEQFRDFCPTFLVSVTCAVISMLPVYLLYNSWAQIVFGALCYVFLYLLLCSCFKVQAFMYAISQVKLYVNRVLRQFRW